MVRISDTEPFTVEALVELAGSTKIDGPDAAFQIADSLTDKQLQELLIDVPEFLTYTPYRVSRQRFMALDEFDFTPLNLVRMNVADYIFDELMGN